LVDPVDIAALVVGSVFVLSWAPLRTPRAYAFLTALALVLIGANLLGEPARFIVKACVISVYGLVVLQFQYVLVGISRSDAAIDKRLTKISSDLNGALSAWERAESRGGLTSPEAAKRRMVAVCEEGIAELDKLHPPSDDWQRTAALMRRYLKAVRDAAAGTGDGREPTALRVSSIAGFEVLRDEMYLTWAQALKPH
jgi:hypothetical protein